MNSNCNQNNQNGFSWNTAAKSIGMTTASAAAAEVGRLAVNHIYNKFRSDK